MFLAIFPLVAKILDAITNFLMGWIIERTKTSQGKARPYLFVSALILPLCGILMYTVPQASQNVQTAWIMITYNLYFSFAYTIYNMSHNLMVPLSTRNSEQRGGVAVFNQIAAIMVTGIIAALVVPMVLLPMMGTSKTIWIGVMSAISLICFPIMFLEYFYTKERVSEEATGEDEKKIPYIMQIKAVFHDRYMVLILLYYFIFALCGGIKTNSVIYFCNYVLGTYSDGITQTLINVIGGLPMGIGIFAVVLNSVSIGIINFALNASGYLVPLTATKDNVAEIYASIAEEGLTAQLALEKLSPTLDGVYTIALVQNAVTANTLTFLFVGLETLSCIICGLIFLFINVERTISFKQKVIEGRRTEENFKIDSETMPELKNEKVAKIWEKESKDMEVYYAKVQSQLTDINQ